MAWGKTIDAIGKPRERFGVGMSIHFWCNAQMNVSGKRMCELDRVNKPWARCL
jgi:hypothetical protein